VAFPVDPLIVELGIAWGADLTADPASWVFADSVSRWAASEPVTIKGGRGDGASQAESRQLDLTLKNPDGYLTPDDARSPLWPNVVDGTPIYWRQDAGYGEVELFAGFITALTPEWPGDSAGAAVVRVSARGQLYRLDQGTPPDLSALYRAIIQTAPLAYWTLEDGPDSTQAASALLDGPPLLLTRGSVRFAGTAGPAGSSSLADFSSGGTMTGLVPFTTTINSWRIEFVTLWREFAPAGFGIPLSWRTGGTIAEWELVATEFGSGGIFFNYTTAAGGSGSSVGAANIKVDDDLWHHLRIDGVQSGGNIVITISLDGVAVLTETMTTQTMGRVNSVIINPTGDTVEEVPSLGHLAIWAPVYAGSVDTLLASRGYVGETVEARITRLCGEAGIPVTITAGDPEPMGAQRPGTLVGLLRDAEKTGGGRLSESGWGLHYLSVAALYNQTAALVVDGGNRELDGGFQPRQDTRGYVNRYTASRSDGSSATAESSDPRRGTWPGSGTFNVQTDPRLADVAGWQVRLGTWPGMRYPNVGVNLTNSPQLVAAVEQLADGDRIQVVNPPRQHSPAPVDQLLAGWTHTIRGRQSWRVRLTGSPAGPWDVAVVDEDQRVPADGSYLAAGVAMDDTTLLMATPVEAPWTTDPTDLPVDIRLGGERITATAITARVAPLFVAAGTGTNGNNTSRTPALPAGWAVGDLLLIYATARSSPDHRAVAPDGYLTLLQDRNIALFGKLAEASESAPVVTYVGGVTNSDTIAQMAAFRGVAPGVMASASQLNTSAQDVACPALTVPQPALILYLGWRQDDWTSVATLPGATEVGSRSGTLGDDAAQVWDYTIQTSQANISAGSLLVTGGAAAISRGAVVALWTHIQTLTVVRGINGIRKAHPTSSGAS
jgi:hypothetical protein